MKDLWKIFFGVVCAFLGAGLILLISSQPRGKPVVLLPPPTPAPLIVHVTGAVVHPGVYRLPAQSRISDAVQAAGGFTTQADQAALNLAAFLQDGSQIQVPVFPTATPEGQISPPTELSSPSITPISSPSPTSYPRLNFPIDINTASALELESLPLIGQVRAARIVAYRQSHGPFKRIEDIRNVYDIDPEVYTAIRDLITIGENTATLPSTPSP
jgi:competence protein ComEA